MDWKEELDGVLGRYSGINAATVPPTVLEDFDRVVEAVPGTALARGLETAFRADETPPLQQMVAELYARSDASQRAGILNLLVTDLGPSNVQGMLLAERLDGLASLLGRDRFLSPAEAAGISPEVVRRLVTEAARKDHAVVEKLTGFYADYPRLLRALDPTTQGIFLGGLADWGAMLE